MTFQTDSLFTNSLLFHLKFTLAESRWATSIQTLNPILPFMLVAATIRTTLTYHKLFNVFLQICPFIALSQNVGEEFIILRLLSLSPLSGIVILVASTSPVSILVLLLPLHI